MKKYCITQHRKQTEPSKSPNGFTLIEVLVTMAMATLILAAVFTVFANYTRSNNIQTITADIQQDINAGISFMEQDIRSAGLNPRELTSGVGFTAASSTAFTFTSDNDFNGQVAVDDPGTVVNELVTSPDESITYTYNAVARTLTRTNLAGPQLVLGNVFALEFTYYDNNSKINVNPIPAASLEDIRAVNINITLSESSKRYGTFSRRIETRVFCRNMNL
jgi:prepilin-type N-terminal cleavage/methylation domain-containing protein